MAWPYWHSILLHRPLTRGLRLNLHNLSQTTWVQGPDFWFSGFRAYDFWDVSPGDVFSVKVPWANFTGYLAASFQINYPSCRISWERIIGYQVSPGHVSEAQGK